MSGGSGPSTTTTGEFKPPSYTVPWWQTLVGDAGSAYGQPYQESGIPTVAPWNDTQQGASQAIIDRAMNGTPESNAGRGAITGIAAGNHSNPWQTMVAGTAAGQSQNPFMAGAAGLAQGGNNPFMAGIQGMAGGEQNPYMIDPQAFIDATSKDMTRAAQTGTMAQTDAAFNRAGAYGGSAYNEQQAANAKALEDSIGTMSAGARMSANQANANMWQQGQQNKLGALGLGNQAYQGGVGNQLQALGLGGNMFSTGLGQQLQAAGLGGNMFQGDIGNMLSAAGMAPAYGQMDQNDFASMMGVGNMQNNYQQQLLNAANGSFSAQQNYPWSQLQKLGGMLSLASGGQGSKTETTTQPGQSPWANGLGLGLGLLSYMLPF